MRHALKRCRAAHRSWFKGPDPAVDATVCLDTPVPGKALGAPEDTIGWPPSAPEEVMVPADMAMCTDAGQPEYVTTAQGPASTQNVTMSDSEARIAERHFEAALHELDMEVGMGRRPNLRPGKRGRPTPSAEVA